MDMDVTVAKDLYQQFRRHGGHGHGVAQGTPELYWQMAKMLCKAREGKEAIAVLRHMMSANFDPTVKDSLLLLDVGLAVGDSVVLKVLSRWFCDNFDHQLELGAVKRILHIASTLGDNHLGNAARQLMKKYGYEADYIDLACLFRAAVLGEDLRDTLETLKEASKRGIDMYLNPSLGRSLQGLLTRMLSRSYKRSGDNISELYFALVELKKQRISVPPVAVNAMIAALGEKGLYEQAYSTFQDYWAIFNLTPTSHTYNALLYATSMSRNASMVSMLSVCQQMEEAGISPDSQSFSLVFSVMAEKGEMQGFDEIASHVRELGVRVHEKSIRKILMRYCYDGNFDKVDAFVAEHYRPAVIPNKDSAEYQQYIRKPCMPKFLRARILSLRTRATTSIANSTHTQAEKMVDHSEERVVERYSFDGEELTLTSS